jgi:phosphohistidine phosphatase
MSPLRSRTLILLRHAKSDWSGDDDDRSRPLAPRGRRQAQEAGRWLDAHVASLDLAVVSPATRARNTWDLAIAELSRAPETSIEDRVYAASATELLGVVHELPDDLDTVVVIGHNPGIEDLVALLTGRSAAMPTSALAVISLSGSWSATSPSSGVLTASGRPPPS